MTIGFSISILLALCGRGGDSADPKSAEEAAPVRIRLSMTTAKLDPFAPGDHRVKCTIQNTSDKPVRVPTVYTAGFDADISLIATSRHKLNLVFWAGPKTQTWKLLEPGKEIVVFEESLRAVLLLDFDGKESKALIPGVKRYYWNWLA